MFFHFSSDPFFALETAGVKSSPGEDSNGTSLAHKFREFIFRIAYCPESTDYQELPNYCLHRLTAQNTANLNILNKIEENQHLLFPNQIGEHDVLPVSLLLFPMEFWTDILTKPATKPPSLAFF